MLARLGFKLWNLHKFSDRIHTTLEPSPNVFLSGDSARTLVQDNRRLTLFLQAIEQTDSSGHISVFGIETDKLGSMHPAETFAAVDVVIHLFVVTFTVFVIAFLSVENLAFHNVLSSASRSVAFFLRVELVFPWHQKFQLPSGFDKSKSH